MNRFSGLENDFTYSRYVETRNQIITILNDDDKNIDVQYVSILISSLANSKKTLDKIKGV